MHPPISRWQRQGRQDDCVKECLRFGLIPFIIEDAKKGYYYRGLSEWEREQGYLTDTCLDGQDTFRKLMALFDIPPESDL